jgi:glucosamine kinase
VKRSLLGLAKTIVVMSDVEAAWLSAFAREGQGIVVISGTGSIAYGKRRDGVFARAGGFGPDKGDEGSGCWIGKEWRKKHPSAPAATVRQIASLAPRVIRQAQRGDAAASAVIRDAQSHLSALVIELARSLSWKGAIPLSVCGSVLDNAWFQRGFFEVLRRKKISVRFQRRKTDPAIAALGYCC